MFVKTVREVAEREWVGDDRVITDAAYMGEYNVTAVRMVNMIFRVGEKLVSLFACVVFFLQMFEANVMMFAVTMLLAFFVPPRVNVYSSSAMSLAALTAGFGSVVVSVGVGMYMVARVMAFGTYRRGITKAAYVAITTWYVRMLAGHLLEHYDRRFLALAAYVVGSIGIGTPHWTLMLLTAVGAIVTKATVREEPMHLMVLHVMFVLAVVMMTFFDITRFYVDNYCACKTCWCCRRRAVKSMVAREARLVEQMKNSAISSVYTAHPSLFKGGGDTTAGRPLTRSMAAHPRRRPPPPLPPPPRLLTPPHRCHRSSERPLMWSPVPPPPYGASTTDLAAIMHLSPLLLPPPPPYSETNVI